MSGFLEAYVVDDARRARRLKWGIGSVLVVLIAGGVLYFTLRSYPAKHKVNQFVEDLQKHDYRGAYQLWGCTASSPCSEYTFEKFMEDWGPRSTHADASSAAIQKTRYCGPGVIVTLGFGKGEDNVPLWYQRSDATLGFAPWPVCAPQPKAYQ